MRQFEAVPELGPAAHQDADGVPARASETSTGLGERSASTISVTAPAACARRAADSASAAWNSSWYCSLGWYSTGRDSA